MSSGADEAALERSYSVAPPVDVATAESLLKEAKQILDQLGVVFFLRQGTCLGAIRDGAIIPWDDDIDLGSIFETDGVTEEMIQTVVSAFEDRGYFTSVERNDHYVAVAMMKSSTRIDWACYRIIDDSIVHYPGVRIPARLFAQLKEIDFIGAKFLVPNPPEEYLLFKYGVDWAIPKKVEFQEDVLAMIPDVPLLGAGGRLSQFLKRNLRQREASRLRVLDRDGKPVLRAEVTIAGIGRTKTNSLGYAKFHLSSDGWYAFVITYDQHEELLYMENVSRSQTYVYGPSSSASSGRYCVLSTEASDVPDGRGG